MADSKHTINYRECKLIPLAKYHIYSLDTEELLYDFLTFKSAELVFENRKLTIVLEFIDEEDKEAEYYFTQEDFQNRYRIQEVVLISDIM